MLTLVTTDVHLDPAVRGMVTHPLIRFARNVQILPGITLRYHVVPEWAAVPGPYDAILQFREDVSARVAARRTASRRRYTFDYAPEMVSEATRAQVSESMPRERYPVYTRYGIVMEELELEPVEVSFAFGPTGLELGEPGTVEARLEWSVTATVHYRETEASLARRRNASQPGYGVPLPQAEAYEAELGSGVVRVTGEVRLHDFGARYHAAAYVDAMQGDYTLVDAAPIVIDYFGRLMERLGPAFGNVPLTPRVVLPGYLAGREVDVDLGAMHTYLRVTHGNEPGTKVLHLCVAFGEAVPERHLEAVRPFIADRGVGFYQAEHVTLEILRRRWAGLSEAARTTEVEVDLPMHRGDEPVTGRARFRVALGALEAVELDTAPEHPDFIKAIVEARMELLAAWDEDGAALDIGELGVIPESADRIGIAYFPFQAPPRDLPPVNRFIDRLLTRLLWPLYTPFHSTEPYRIQALDGHTSQPIGAIFLRANLEA